MSASHPHAKPFSVALRELAEAHDRELIEARKSSQHHVATTDVHDVTTRVSNIPIGTVHAPAENVGVTSPTAAWTSIAPMAPSSLPGGLHILPSAGDDCEVVPMSINEVKEPKSPETFMPMSSIFCEGDPDTTEREREPDLEAKMAKASAEEGELMGMLAPIQRPFMRCAQWWSELKEPDRKGWLAQKVMSTRFSLACTGVILLNSLYTYIGTNLSMEQKTHDLSATHTYIELFFMSFYCLEIALKLKVHHLYFFCNHEMAWNIFDFVLVMQGVLDVVVMFFQVKVLKATFARLLRILKLGKIFRVFRAIRFLRDLRVLMSSIVSSLACLTWSLVLIALCLYMTSIAFVQMLTGYLVENGDDIDPETAVNIQYFFGNVGYGMRTLFMCTNGGIDWLEIQVLLAKEGSLAEFFLLMFMLFWHFSIVNIITGIVMEKAVRNSQPDRDTIMMEQRFQREMDAVALKQIFNDLDDDQSGTVNQQEFEEKLDDRKLLAYLATLDINVSDLKNLFSLLLKSAGNDEIGIETFVHQCIQMKGFATALDLNVLMFQVELLQKQLGNMDATIQAIAPHFGVKAPRGRVVE